MLDMVPVVDIFEGRDYSYFLWEGFSYGHKDIVEEKIFFRPYTDLDKDFKVLVEKTEESDVYINCNFDYTKVLYRHTYFTFKDVVKDMGALKAVILPLIALSLPFMALGFHFKLARIIQKHHDKDCKEAIDKYFDRSKKVCEWAIEQIKENRDKYSLWKTSQLKEISLNVGVFDSKKEDIDHDTYMDEL